MWTFATLLAAEAKRLGGSRAVRHFNMAPKPLGAQSVACFEPQRLEGFQFMNVVHSDPPYEVCSPARNAGGDSPDFFVFAQGSPYPVAGPFKAKKDAVDWTVARNQETEAARAALVALLAADDQKIYREVGELDRQMDELQREKEAKLSGLSSDQAKRLAFRH